MRLKLIIWSAAVLACTLLATAFAQTWPSRPVRIIVPYPPGGGIDTVARLLAQKLGEQMKGSFVVDNRPGGTGVIGAELLTRAAPDGYTLMASATEFAINPARRKLPYDPFKDFTHISELASVQFLLVSHPSVPVKNVKQLLALAKAQPGRITYGSAGTGGGPHLAAELFRMMSGIRWVHVPFKGAGPALVGVMSGEVDFAFSSTIALLGAVKAGRIRAIAVTGAKRFPALPDVPTIGESGVPGYVGTGWYGFYAPAGTSQEIVRRLYVEAGRALNSADAKEKLAKAGNELVMSSPQEFTAFLRSEITKWSKVVNEAGLRID